MKKYYFITYERTNKNTGEVQRRNLLIHQHPLFWINPPHADNFHNYVIVFWAEIPEEIARDERCHYRI
jgi:hypothetical protein